MAPVVENSSYFAPGSGFVSAVLDYPMVTSLIERANPLLEKAKETAALLDERYQVNQKVQFTTMQAMQYAMDLDKKYDVRSRVKSVNKQYKIIDTATELANRGLDITKQTFDVARNPDVALQKGAEVMTKNVKEVAVKGIQYAKETSVKGIQYAKDLDSHYEVTANIKNINSQYNISEKTLDYTTKATDYTKQTYSAVKVKDPTGRLQKIEDLIAPYADEIAKRLLEILKTLNAEGLQKELKQ